MGDVFVSVIELFTWNLATGKSRFLAALGMTPGHTARWKINDEHVFRDTHSIISVSKEAVYWTEVKFRCKSLISERSMRPFEWRP